LWPAGAAGPLAFRPLEPVATVALAGATGDLANITGDQVFVAARRGTDVVVAAADLATGAVAWEQTITGLQGVTALSVMGGAVLVHGDEFGSTHPRPLVGLDVATGAERWRRDFYGDDGWFLAGEVATLADNHEHVLHGLEPATGRELWTMRFPQEEPAAVVPVVTEPDLAARGRLRDTYDVPRADPRVVVVGADRSATVVDTRTGGVVGTGVNIGSPGDKFAAYGDRLYTAEPEDGYRLYAYDLTDLSAQPGILYRAPAAGRTPVWLVPCGDALVCLLETGGDQPPDVVALDSGGGEVWRQPVPSAEHLFPVGGAVVVGTTEPSVVVYDGEGRELLRRPGVAVRLDVANLLLWAAEPGDIGSQASVAGISVTGGAARRVELGQANSVRAAGCAWDTRYLACPVEEGAAVWSFADP